jgi:uncharacterized protein (DUF58 family)
VSEGSESGVWDVGRPESGVRGIPGPELELHWRPSRLAVRLGVCAAAALVAAIATRQPELIGLAAPLLGALAAGAIRRPPARATVAVDPADPRCFEGEELPVDVQLTAPGCDQARVDLVEGNGVDVIHAEPDGDTTHWVLSPPAWGRFAPTLRVTARAAAGLLVATADIHPLRVRVFPRPTPLTGSLSSADLPDRIGAHLARRPGEGVEFAGIRPYVPGDQLRTVNWAVTARKGGRLHVTERLAERSADVAALLDTYALALEPGATSYPEHIRDAMSLAVHGAAEVVQAALRRGDRSGVIVLGGRLRWLGPDIGRRQFYRVVDAVLDAYPVPGDDIRSPAGHTDFVPRGVLPTGSIVVAFTPLLDSRIVLGLQDVRLRGYAVVVVDVLRELPGAGVDPLVARMWKLERSRMHRNFALLGIPVVPWHAGAALDEVLTPLARRPLSARRLG